MKIINQQKKYSSRFKDLIYMKSYRRILLRVAIYLIFLMIALTIALLPNIIRNINHIEKPNEIARLRFATDLKYILFWKLYSPKRNLINPVIYSLGQKEFIKQTCPHFNCYVTYNKSLLGDERNFDAVVFDITDIRKLHMNHIEMNRSPHQIYVFKSLESAENHPLCDPFFDNFFNWTWTYRGDSDIPHYFLSVFTNEGSRIGPNNGVAWKRDMEHSEAPLKLIPSKTKAVAWLITNCKLKTKYRILIKELKEELKGYNYTLDIIGPCSSRKCKKGRISQCYNIIEHEYFFNLVTEDSIAEDYVTEKMMRAMHYLTVPLVYGGANYSNFLPPGSYINVRDFSLKKLGAVIDYLIKNPSKYIYFFDWRQYYYYTSHHRNRICDLCTKLNQKVPETKSYKDMRSWWNPDFDEVCQRTQLYDMFNKPLTHKTAAPSI